jgi:hypothetical protein
MTITSGIRFTGKRPDWHRRGGARARQNRGGASRRTPPKLVDPQNAMKRHLRLFLLYFAQYAKVRMAYKADFFIAVFSSMAATVLGFGFVLVLFSKIPKL